jgi:hypothetical protein
MAAQLRERRGREDSPIEDATRFELPEAVTVDLLEEHDIRSEIGEERPTRRGSMCRRARLRRPRPG